MSTQARLEPETPSSGQRPLVRAGRVVTAIEVKSGTSKRALAGMAAFVTAFRPQRTLLVGGDGIPMEQFLMSPVEKFVRAAGR